MAESENLYPQPPLYRTCPVTGLPITEKLEYSSGNDPLSYKTRVFLISDRIILSEGYGYAKRNDLKEAMQLSNRMEQKITAGSYIYIADYTYLRGATLEARKYYIEIMQSRQRLKHLIFHGTSPMFNMSIKLAKRFYKFKFKVHIEKDYAAAMRLAKTILMQWDLKSAQETREPRSEPVALPAVSDICPVTGLKIITKPEWTDIDLGQGYRVTFKWIGPQILYSSSSGNAGEHGMANLFLERAKVLSAMLGPQEPFLELRDYSAITGRINKIARDQLAVGLRTTEDRLIGWIGFQAPLPVRMAINVGRHLHKAKFPMMIVEDYPAAIRKAVERLARANAKAQVLPPPDQAGQQWILEQQGYTTRYRLIHRNVIWGTTAGFMREQHVAPIFELFEKIRSAAELKNHDYYFVFDIRNLEGATFKARRIYIEGFKRWYAEHPFRMLIFCNANRWINSAVNLARPLLSFKVRVFSGPESVLKYLQEKNPETAGPDLLPEPGPEKTKNLPAEVQRYIDELLYFIGRINWEVEGIEPPHIPDLDHPIMPVFDAITLLKSDLDNLSQARKQTELELKESETRLTTILESVQTGIVIIDRETHRIMDVNPVGAKWIGTSKENIVGSICHKFICPAEKDKCPITDLGQTVDNSERVLLTTQGIRRPIIKTVVTVTLNGRECLLENFVDISARRKAEEDLKIEKSYMDRLFDSAPEAICMGDIQHRLVRINPEFTRLFGYEPEEVIGKTIDELVAPSRLMEEAKGMTEAVDRAGRPISLESKRRRKDGSLIDVSILASPITLDNKTIGNYGIYRDITARKSAEEALRKSEEKYRDIFDSVSDCLFFHDLNGYFLEANQAFRNTSGIKEEEVKKLSVQDIMPMTHKPRFKDYLARIRAKGEDSGRFRIVSRDGRQLVIEYRNLLVTGPQGPLYVQGWGRDITKRLESEKALKENEEKYRTILESIEEGYYEVDLTGRFTFFNDSMSRMLGYYREELLGKDNREYTDEINARKMFAVFSEVFKTGKPAIATDWEIIRKDGHRRFMETSVSLVMDQNNQAVGFKGIARDITERKQSESLHIAKQEAEAASQAKSRFLAHMSHEIRTPLNGIIGMAELGLETGLDDQQHNILQTINTEANSLLNVVNDILDFSKIEAGKLELENISFELRPLIEEVAQSLALQAEKKSLDLISYVSPDLPCALLGDPGRLRQILLNLASNAVKFTEQGEIYLKAELDRAWGDDFRIDFTVQDTGIGISAKKQAKIFESFTQGDNSTTRRYGGTGLGTSISKQLVELMGGEIRIDSEEGKGSTFSFSIPFRPSPAAEGPEGKQKPGFEGGKILVVDDNTTRRTVLKQYLRDWNCEVIEASVRCQAVGLLKNMAVQNHGPDLILIDCRILETNGSDPFQDLKDLTRAGAIPAILLVTAGKIKPLRERSPYIKATLLKPISRAELGHVIQSVLESSEKKNKTVKEIFPVPTDPLVTPEQTKRILLVEDYPTNQRVSLQHLESRGYRVDLAENGKQALDICKVNHYDLVLMDIQMPVMDGFEATRAIRKWEQPQASGRRIPIVAMTAHATQEHKHLCLEAGMDDFLTKPLRRKELLAMVAKWVSLNETMGPVKKHLPESTTTPMPPETAAGAPPMDFDKAVDEFEGDREFLLDVLSKYLEHARRQVSVIRQALETGNADPVMKEAHAIKGGAANLCADVLAEVARELEFAGRGKNLEKGPGLLKSLEAELIRLQAFHTQQVNKKTEPLSMLQTNRNQPDVRGEVFFKP
ncbi:MAG: PAS domain S-box protein [Desulfobacteraceae bacterium]|nr:MAG: PAS domain S-box protein [Desulfobacteraceae bacterium]